MTSLIQNAGLKLAALTVVFSRLTHFCFYQTGREIEWKTTACLFKKKKKKSCLFLYYSIAVDRACEFAVCCLLGLTSTEITYGVTLLGRCDFAGTVWLCLLGTVCLCWDSVTFAGTVWLCCLLFVGLNVHRDYIRSVRGGVTLLGRCDFAGTVWLCLLGTVWLCWDSVTFAGTVWLCCLLFCWA